MRPMLILCLTTAALLGACASRSTAGTDACTQRCATADLSSLERSSCELDCSRLASSATTPPSTPPTTPPTTAPPQPEPPPQPLPPQQPPPQPLPPKAAPPQPLPPTAPPTPPRPSPQPTPAGSTTNYSLPPGGGPPVPTPAPGSPQSVDRQAIANCESACIRENLSATDHATCKLNCNAVGTTYAPAPSYYILGGTPPSDADARAAVIRSSGGVIGSTPSPQPPPSQPGPPPSQDKVVRCATEAQQCNSSCAGQGDPCTRGCDEAKMSTTDRATCKLTCESSVDMCRDDCRIKEGNCRNKP